MTVNKQRTLKRLVALAIVLTTSLGLPTVAQARHTTCDTAGENFLYNDPDDYCPEFSPGMSTSIRFPYRDFEATIKVELSQAPHESLPLLTEVYYPKDWQFSVGSIRPSSAANCDDAVGDPGSLNNAEIEALSDANGMSAYVGDTGSTKKRFGRATTSKNDPSNMLGFLRWEPGYTDPTDTSVSGRAVLCLGMEQIDSNTSDIVETLYLERLTESAEFGWRLVIDTGKIFDPATEYFNDSDPGLFFLKIDMGGLTKGNWHRNANNVKAATVWSRAPRTPQQAAIKTVMTTCRSGVTHTDGYKLSECPAGDEFSVEMREDFVVSLPPVVLPQPFSKVSAAGHTPIPGSGQARSANPRPVEGFGFSDGSDENGLAGGSTIPVEWKLPAVGAGVTVSGFALALQELTTFQKPTALEEFEAGRLTFHRFSTADACTGDDCSVDLDLAAITPENVTIDGKYNIGLVTIYDLDVPAGSWAGIRSDGLCDGVINGNDPTDDGRGVFCPGETPAWTPAGAQNLLGASRWQVVARQKAWPQRFLASNSGAPFVLLLLDLDGKHGEYYEWGATVNGNQKVNWAADVGPGTRREAYSNLMVYPTGPETAIVSFGDLDLGSDHRRSWQFSGEIGLPTRPAYGQLHEYKSGYADLDGNFTPVLPPTPGMPDPQDPLSYDPTAYDPTTYNPQNPRCPDSIPNTSVGQPVCSHEGEPEFLFTEFNGNPV